MKHALNSMNVAIDASATADSHELRHEQTTNIENLKAQLSN